MTGRAKVSPREGRFIEEYLIDRNAAQAAIRAGYSAHTAKQQGHRLLKRPAVAAEVEARSAQVSRGVELTVERVRREMARVAFADPRKLYDDNGNLRPVHELDDDAAAVVASIEQEELFEGRGQDREQVGTVRKVKLWDKGRALELAAKHLGMVKDQPAFSFANMTLIIDEGRDEDYAPLVRPAEQSIPRVQLREIETGVRSPELALAHARELPRVPHVPAAPAEITEPSAALPEFRIED